jgi:DNA-binding NtrC family response regulator
MNGIELMSAVRRQRRTMPSILITAYGSNDVIASARKAGAVGCFSKPFKIEDIKQCLKKALEGEPGTRSKARGRKTSSAKARECDQPELTRAGSRHGEGA